MARLVDLTRAIFDRMPVFPGDPKTVVLPQECLEEVYCRVSRLELSSHLGTHVDAPRHFMPAGRSVDKLDLSRAIGPAHVIDMSYKSAGEEIDVSDLAPHAARISAGCRVVIRTGWDKHFLEPGYFRDQPSLTRPTCRWLTEQGIAVLALDTPTVCPSDDVAVHRILLDADVILIEGLCGLDQLRRETVVLLASPLPIRGGDAAPCRVLAFETDCDEELLWPTLHE